MEKLSYAIAMSHAVLDYGEEWVNLAPRVSVPTLCQALLDDGQLLTTLRAAVVDARQIRARNETMYAERATDRLDSIIHALNLLYPLVIARIMSEFPDSEGGEQRHRPSGILSPQEWEAVRKQQEFAAQGGRLISGKDEARRRQAQDLSALLAQMRMNIVTNPDLFSLQLQRVLQLLNMEDPEE